MRTAVAMAVACVALSAAPATGQQGPAGCWVGTVGSGQQMARAVMRLERSGEWTGTMSVMGRTMRVDTLRSVMVRGDSVTFDYGAGERETSVAVALGTGDGLAGTLTRGPATQPVALARNGGDPVPARALVGYWNGSLQQNGATVLRAGLRFRTAPCGQVYVTFDSPDQGASDLPVTSIALAGDSLQFGMQYVDGAFRGTVSADGTRITGLWTQAGNTLDIEFTKGDGN